MYVTFIYSWMDIVRKFLCLHTQKLRLWGPVKFQIDWMWIEIMFSYVMFNVESFQSTVHLHTPWMCVCRVGDSASCCKCIKNEIHSIWDRHARNSAFETTFDARYVSVNLYVTINRLDWFGPPTRTLEKPPPVSCSSFVHSPLTRLKAHDNQTRRRFCQTFKKHTVYSVKYLNNIMVNVSDERQDNTLEIWGVIAECVDQSNVS